MTQRLVVTSVVRHTGAVLEQFLTGLERLDTQEPAPSFVFVDDTGDVVAANMLAAFGEQRPGVVVIPADEALVATSFSSDGAQPDNAQPYGTVWRVAAMKDALLAEAVSLGAGHVLLVDSSLVLPPPLASHLLSLGLDIVSEVFWSAWQEGAPALPNVWLSDQYNFFPPELARAGTNEQSAAAHEFVTRLRDDGTYLVGGLGGCTLISRAALDAGVSFKALPNLTFWGDDRHFSLRATALGFPLWADTHFAPLHLYRECDLGSALHFWSKWAPEVTEKWLTGGPVVEPRQRPDAASAQGAQQERNGGRVSKPTHPEKTRPARQKRGASKRVTPRAVAKSSGSNVLFSACLIVKDEEKALPGCLESLKGLVDEIVVYDTGSTDRTLEIARHAGAKVIEGYWDDDFGRARNASLEHCVGDWVLWIDADEHFVCDSTAELRSIMRQQLTGMDADALAVDINNMVGDGSQAGNLHRALRIFRRSTCCWYGSLHEQVDVRPGVDRRAIVLPLVGARIDHYGYIDQIVMERGKLDRNLRLAQAELAGGVVRPDQIGVAQLNVGRALAALGRLAEAQDYLEEALSLVVPGIPTRTVLLFTVQNLLALSRFEEAITVARRFRELCQNKGLADYFEGVAQRRIGRPELAAALFQRVEQMNNEDGFAFSDTLVIAELAGALLESGRAAEAADQLVLLVEQKPDLVNLTAALQVFAATGKSIETLVAAMPEDRLDRIGAALIMVPPSVADPMAEALFVRFGPRPLLLAAAIRFAPMVPVARALEWSARLRAAGMEGSCPLVGQALIEVLDPAERVRAAVTAHAAFGDQRAADIALSLAPGVSEASLPNVLGEVNVLNPALMASFATAAAGPAALGEELGGTPESRRQVVATTLARLGILSLGDELTSVRA
jgi:tetratricopeptide (TPR) repeat protein